VVDLQTALYLGLTICCVGTEVPNSACFFSLSFANNFWRVYFSRVRIGYSFYLLRRLSVVNLHTHQPS